MLTVLTRAKPEQQAAKSNVDQQMLPKTPSHAVKVLGREDGPDEEMSPQRCTSCHDKGNAGSCKDSEQGQVLLENILLALTVLLQQEQICCRCPEDRPCPVADEGEETNSDDIEAANAVIGAGEVDRGDGVGAAEGKEGHVLEEDG